MADYYRKAAAGDNKWTTATNWAIGSMAGASASVAPTSSDNVIFTATSAATTLDAAGNCNNLDFTGAGASSYTSTFTHGAFNLNVYGNATMVAGMTYTATNGVFSGVTFKATSTGKTFTSAGKVYGPVAFDGVGGGWTLQDALTSVFTITVTNGSFNSNAKTITAGYFLANNSNTKTITIASSTMTLSGTSISGVGPYYVLPTGTTLSSNSCGITCTGAFGATAASLHFAGGSYGNFSMTTITGSVTLLGTNSATFTFGTVVLIGGEGAVSAGIVYFTENMQCTNFSPTGTSSTSRLWIRSSVRGVQRTITANGGFYGNALYGTSNYIDWQDIAPTGTSTPTNWGTGVGSNLGYGNAGNNGANITFSAARTLYGVSTGGNWDNTATWSSSSSNVATTRNASSGQAPPLPQDNVVIDATSGGTFNTHWYILLGNNITFTGFTGTWSHPASQPVYVFGNLTLASGMTITTGTDRSLYFFLGGQTLTSAGKTLACPVYIECPGATTTFADAYVGTSSLNLTQGTLTATAAAVTTLSFASSNSYTRALTLGSNTVSLTGTGTVWDVITTTGLTFTCGTSTIDMTDGSATGKTFVGQALTYYTIKMSGAGSATYWLANSFTCTNLISTKAVAFTIQFGWLQTYNITSWQVTGTAGNVVTVTSNAGIVHTINVGTVPTVSYLNLSYSQIYPAGNVSNGTDSGSNTNWFFTASSTKRLLMLMGVGT